MSSPIRQNIRILNVKDINRIKYVKIATASLFSHS